MVVYRIFLDLVLERKHRVIVVFKKACSFFEMAKSQKDLKGWQYYLRGSSGVKDGLSSSRRSRRGGGGGEKLVLKREDDDLEISSGCFLLVQEAGNEPEIAMVKEVLFGNVNFIDIVVSWFLRIKDIDPVDLAKIEDYKDEGRLNENEVFVTSYLDEIRLSDIITRVNVISQKTFEAEIDLDDSTKLNTFVCRRGCDQAGEAFSDPFDFTEIFSLFQSDNNAFFDFITRQTIPPTYKLSRKKSDKTPVTEENQGVNFESDKKVATRPRGRPRKRVEKKEGSEDGLQFNKKPKLLSDSDDEVENDVSDDKQVLPKKEETTPRKTRKRTKTHADSPSVDEESRQCLASLNKRMKIKDSSRPLNLTLSPKKPKITQNMGKQTLGIDSTSQAFKEMKAKLHASAKINSLPCREDEFTSLYLSLENAIQEEVGSCLYVSGTPGVGKTATIREVVSQLRESNIAGDLKDFDYLEINGLSLVSPALAYEVLWQKISGLKVTASNAALLLENYFSQGGERKPLVVLMDELDQIVTKKQNVMYNFFNWPSYQNSKLIIVAVANTMDLPERVLSNKITSRLSLRRLQFVGYTYEQLGAIIKHRLEMLSEQNKRTVLVSNDAVGYASRKVASVSGDARRALAICRRAVEISEEDSLRSRDILANDKIENEIFHVQISHISKAINESINTFVALYIICLPFASRLILVAILLRKKRSGLAENPLGDIIEEIKNTSVTLTTKYLEDLIPTSPPTNIVDLLYGRDLFGASSNHVSKMSHLNLRILKFTSIINELAESGIIILQNLKGERHRLVSLNVSEDEVLTALKRDDELLGLL